MSHLLCLLSGVAVVGGPLAFLRLRASAEASAPSPGLSHLGFTLGRVVTVWQVKARRLVPRAGGVGGGHVSNACPVFAMLNESLTPWPSQFGRSLLGLFVRRKHSNYAFFPIHRFWHPLLNDCNKSHLKSSYRIGFSPFGILLRLSMSPAASLFMRSNHVSGCRFLLFLFLRFASSSVPMILFAPSSGIALAA